jgi:hypothetical protein
MTSNPIRLSAGDPQRPSQVEPRNEGWVLDSHRAQVAHALTHLVFFHDHNGSPFNLIRSSTAEVSAMAPPKSAREPMFPLVLPLCRSLSLEVTPPPSGVSQNAPIQRRRLTVCLLFPNRELYDPALLTQAPYFSSQLTELEDYAISALQVELRNEARSRSGPHPEAAIREPRGDYTGCRQFYQSGYCHFGRGRKPCPNENSHYCLQCNRAHGTGVHLVLLKRLMEGTLTSQSTLQ